MEFVCPEVFAWWRLYKAPPQRELSDEDRATLAAGGTLAPTAAPGGIAGTGVTVLTQAKPPPPPEAPGAYKKKSGESGGVSTMIIKILSIDSEFDKKTYCINCYYISTMVRQFTGVCDSIEMMA